MTCKYKDKIILSLKKVIYEQIIDEVNLKEALRLGNKGHRAGLLIILYIITQSQKSKPILFLLIRKKIKSHS